MFCMVPLLLLLTYLNILFTYAIHVACYPTASLGLSLMQGFGSYSDSSLTIYDCLLGTGTVDFSF